VVVVGVVVVVVVEVEGVVGVGGVLTGLAPKGDDMSKKTIIFGVFAYPLARQLDVRPSRLVQEQRSADAITRLAIIGLLTEAEARRVRLRLAKRIAARLDRASGGGK
jgi:hypothetical protein